jgi:hypothetical protein
MLDFILNILVLFSQTLAFFFLGLTNSFLGYYVTSFEQEYDSKKNKNYNIIYQTVKEENEANN